MYKCGITWHPELEDKVEPIVQHASWAIDNCDKDPLKLKASMLNVVQHYKGIHDKCHASSRCQQDPKYEPSRILIQYPKAERLLQQTMNKCVLVTSPVDFTHGKNTF